MPSTKSVKIYSTWVERFQLSLGSCFESMERDRSDLILTNSLAVKFTYFNIRIFPDNISNKICEGEQEKIKEILRHCQGAERKYFQS